MGFENTPHLPSSVGHPLPWERAAILISIHLPWGGGGRKAEGAPRFAGRGGEGVGKIRKRIETRRALKYDAHLALFEGITTWKG